jgi:hypothetical protein
MSPDVVWLDSDLNMPSVLDIPLGEARQRAFELKLQGMERVWIVDFMGQWDEIQLNGVML